MLRLIPFGSRLRLNGVSSFKMAHPTQTGDRTSRTWKKRVWERERRGGLSTIPAGRTRQRLQTLSRVGIGRKAVHEFTGIDHRTLGRIKNGQTQRVRKETRELIFSVPMNAFCDKAVIDGTATRRLIGKLTSFDMGFTQAEIARRLGRKQKCPNLFIGRKGNVIAKSAMKIEQLYNSMRA